MSRRDPFGTAAIQFEMSIARQREAEILRKFVLTFCRTSHRSGRNLCSECSELLDYALVRLDRCPYDPKPICRRCPTHCYEPAMREKMRQVMRFSGLHFVRRGRLDWLIKYYLLSRQLAKSEVNLRRETPSASK